MFWTAIDDLRLSPTLDTTCQGENEAGVRRYCWNHFDLQGQHINSATIAVWGGERRTHAMLELIEPVEDDSLVAITKGEPVAMRYGDIQRYYKVRFKETVIRPMKEAIRRSRQ